MQLRTVLSSIERKMLPIYFSHFLRFPLEMHMVHRTRNREKVAVIAILFNFGDEDRFLAQVLASLSSQRITSHLYPSLTMCKVSELLYVAYSFLIGFHHCQRKVRCSPSENWVPATWLFRWVNITGATMVPRLIHHATKTFFGLLFTWR